MASPVLAQNSGDTTQNPAADATSPPPAGPADNVPPPTEATPGANVTAAATYVSSTPAKATVNAAGKVTAVATGTTDITATYKTKTDTITVTVS